MTNKKDFIKKYKKDGDTYTIEYLDGSIVEYICSDSNHEQFLIETMLEQITDICNTKSFEKEEFKKNANAVSALTSSVLCVVSHINDNELSTYIFLLLAYFNFIGIVEHKKQLNYLKKFKMFLEMNPHLE